MTMVLEKINAVNGMPKKRKKGLLGKMITLSKTILMKNFNAIVCLLLIISGLYSCKTQNLLVQEKADISYQHIDADSAFLFDEMYGYRLGKDDKISMSFLGVR